MKRAFLAGILPGILLATAPLTAVSAQDWGATFTRTEGGHMLGDPDAPTTMILFASYSCSHCASFEQQSDAPLRLAYIQTGQVSMEVRHVIRNPLDLAAILTAECGDESKFWGNHRAILRTQDRWLEVAVNATAAQSARWTAGAIGTRMRAIASDLDFYELMGPRGYSISELDRCLTDRAAITDIVSRFEADNARWNISGTPSFVVNGTLLEGTHTWAALQPQLSPQAE